MAPELAGKLTVEAATVAAVDTGKEASMDMVEKKLWNIKDDEARLDLVEGTVLLLLADADEVKEKMPPSWLAQAKDVMFAGKNLPAMATLVASSAATGMIAAAANPAICFGFYAIFMAAIAVVTISLHDG